MPDIPVDPQIEVQQLKEANAHLKKKIRIEHQRGHRHDKKTEKLAIELKEMKENRLPGLERELEKVKSEVAYARNEVKRLCETAKTHEQRMQDFQQRL